LPDESSTTCHIIAQKRNFFPDRPIACLTTERVSPVPQALSSHTSPFLGIAFPVQDTYNESVTRENSLIARNLCHAVQDSGIPFRYPKEEVCLSLDPIGC
jgi:hypothetical protein